MFKEYLPFLEIMNLVEKLSIFSNSIFNDLSKEKEQNKLKVLAKKAREVQLYYCWIGQNIIDYLDPHILHSLSIDDSNVIGEYALLSLS